MKLVTCFDTFYFYSVGHRVKTHKITPAVGNECEDIEIKDYIVLPSGEDNNLPPHTLITDFTLTHHTSP